MFAPPHLFSHIVRITVAALLFSAAPCWGQTYTWISNNTGNWSTASNWLNNTPPVSGAGTRLVFAPTGLVTSDPSPFAINDIANPFALSFLDLNPSFGGFYNAGSSGYPGLALLGNPLRFVQQGANLPAITVSGAAAGIGTNLQFDAATTIGGAGHGHLIIYGRLSGASGLTINRSSNGGMTILRGDNSGYAGGITLQGGTLEFNNGNGNPLGSGTLTAAGGRLLLDSSFANGFTLANAINAQSDFRFVGGTATSTGIVNGPGGVVSESGSISLQGVDTYTGRTVAGVGTLLQGSTVNLSGFGSALTTSGVDIGAGSSFVLDNSNGNVTNRLADSVVVTSNGGTFRFRGSASDPAASETVGSLVGAGFTTVDVVAFNGRTSTLTFGGAAPIGRPNGGAVLFSGTNLGQSAPGTANTASVLFTNSSTVTAALIGNTANTASTTATDVAILPYAVGALTATTAPVTFVTYDPTKGVRPLPTSQFAALANGTVTQNNVRVTSSVTVTDPTTVNSLLIESGGGTSGSGTLTVTSGAVLATSSAGVGDLRFPGEGFLTSSSNVMVNSITGTSAGLVVSGTGGSLTVSTPLAVPGPLTLNGRSFIVPSFTTAPVLGTVTDVRLNGGQLQYTGTGTDSTARGFALGAAGGTIDSGSPTAGFNVTSATAALTLSGQLTDLPGQAGVLNKTGPGTLILSGSNQYTGKTIINAGTLRVSADNNLGAGAVVLSAMQVGFGPYLAGTLEVNGSFATSRSLVLTNSATGTVSVTAGNRFTINGPIDTDTSTAIATHDPLIKDGPGTLVVGGTNNSMNGQFTVAAGTLLVNGSLAPVNYVGTDSSDAPSAQLSVQSGGAVGGTGSINRAVGVFSGATLAPGDPLTAFGAGALTAERLTLNDGATWLVDVRSAVARSGGTAANVNTNDRLVARGPVTFGTSAFTLTFDGTGQTFTQGKVYDYYIASAASYANFDATKVTFAQTNFSTPGTFNLGLSGPDLIATFTPAPEPGSVLGIAAAGLGLVGWTRRRSSAAIR